MDNLLTRSLVSLCESDSDTARIIKRDFDKTASLLETYIAEIERFNPAYGLVSVKSHEELVTRHIIDSLSPLGIIARLLDGRLLDGRMLDPQRLPGPAGAVASAPPRRVADAGSGAGLPGIPLAVCLPSVHFTLIERMGRRAGFLRNVQAILGLSNITVEETEMEKAEGNRFDVIVFRAFRPLQPSILKSLTRLLKADGVLAAYKGRREAIDAEMAAAATELAGREWQALPCPAVLAGDTPLTSEERHLVVIAGERACSA
jgi:16S rRNA (guanine527-N7)-methyltransferase